MPDPSITYLKKQQASQRNILKRIKKIYEDSITEIVFKASTFPYRGEIWQLKNFPILEQRVNATIADMHESIYATTVNGIEQSWDISNQKNNVIVDQRLGGKFPTMKGRQILFDPNLEALTQFLTRKERGLNLSERVWNALDPFKYELEQGLGLGIAKGQSAASMATELKGYLNEPERLFRKVRNEEGKLVLSKKARNYHPGQGVYRSSYQNAYRLTRTETNISYRTADHERWSGLPFVVGIEIKTSVNNHLVFDICDTLQGKYPKDFKWNGWHPACRCHQLSIQMTEEEYSKYEDSILNGTSFTAKSDNTVKDVPKAFDRYLEKNADTINGYKRVPYFIKDNVKYTADLVVSQFEKNI